MNFRGEIEYRLSPYYHFWRKFFKYGGFKYYGWLWLISPSGRLRIRKSLKNKKDHIRRKQKYGSGFLSRTKKVKQNMIMVRGSFCLICNKKFLASELTVDHIIRVSDGGTNDYKNLQLLCRPCHVKKDLQYKSPYETTKFFPLKEALERYEKQN